MNYIIKLFTFIFITGFSCCLLMANPITIEYPIVVEKSIEYCVVNKIHIDDNHTEIFFYYRNPHLIGGWVNFSRSATLEILRDGKSYKLQYAKGIPLSPYKRNLKYGEGIYFSLVFQSILKEIKRGDFIRIKENIQGGFLFSFRLYTDSKEYSRQYRLMNDFIDKQKATINNNKEKAIQNKKQRKRKELKKDPDFKIE